MRKILKQTIVNLLVLILTSNFYPGLALKGNLLGNYFNWIVAAFSFTLLNRLLKPVLKLVFLPVNLLTLGLFRWVIDVITLFTLTKIVPFVTINAFTFNGISQGPLTIASFNIPYIFSLILGAFFINILRQIIRWLLN